MTKSTGKALECKLAALHLLLQRETKPVSGADLARYLGNSPAYCSTLLLTGAREHRWYASEDGKRPWLFSLKPVPPRPNTRVVRNVPHCDVYQDLADRCNISRNQAREWVLDGLISMHLATGATE